MAVAAALTPPDRLARLLAEAKDGTLVSYEESPGGTVAVIEQGRPGASFRRLYISGASNSGDAIGSLRYMRLQALLPLLVHTQEPRSALVVALGTGITAGALTQYPDWNAASRPSCCLRWCVPCRNSRVTTTSAAIPDPTSACATAATNCCAAPSAMT
ncbi:hypothetical protein ACU4GD_07755 [Cupriavidus basilensis]